MIDEVSNICLPTTFYGYSYQQTLYSCQTHLIALVANNFGKLFKAYVFNIERLKKMGLFETTVSNLEKFLAVHSKHIEKGVQLINQTSNLILFTEYYGESNLETYLQNWRKAEEFDVQKFAVSLFDGLDALHSMGIAHNQIRLQNISIDDSLDIRLGNFGFCQKNSATGIETLSKQELNYLSPEIIQDRLTNEMANDVWCMGVMIYTLITGQFPFAHNNNIKLVNNIINCNFTLPEDIGPMITYILRNTLVKDFNQRATANEIHTKIRSRELTAPRMQLMKQLSVSVGLFSPSNKTLSTDFLKSKKVHIRTRLPQSPNERPNSLPKKHQIHAAHSTFF